MIDGFSTQVRVPSVPEREVILRTTNTEVENLLRDIRSSVSPNLPRDLLAGTIMGYLRGRGHSWEVAMTVMDAYFVSATRPPRRHSFKVEMITCSVGCAEYLKVCLSRNMRHFDNTIVVTAPDDEASQQTAEKAGASVLVTDRFYRQGMRFNRGDAYNRALGLSRHGDWITFVDADIVLAPDHRARLEAYGLHDDVFYGCDRLNVLGDEERRRFLAGEFCSPVLQSAQEWGFGYYQMFNMKSPFLKAALDKGEVLYPSANDVGHSDYLFRKQFGSGHMQKPDGVWVWDPLYQQKLPWACYHLGSDGEGKPSRTIHY